MRFHLIICGLGLLVGAGCATPLPSYQKVDQAAPAFKLAVSQETQRLQTAGQSAGQAERTATKNVTAQFIAAEAQRRQDLVAPLLVALRAMARPAGCWAYTVTTTTHTDKGTPTKVKVENYDPSLPAERAWTLVSTDGKAPDEKAQAEYRKGKSSRAKVHPDQQTVAAPSDDDRMTKRILRDALNTDFQTEVAGPENTAFIFRQDKISLSTLVSARSARFTYLVENRTGALRREAISLQGVSAMAGFVKVDPVEVTLDFAQIDPSLPPFIDQVSVNFKAHVLLLGSIAASVEMEYAGYHRVECHQEGMQVQLGPLEIINDTLPH